MQVPHYEHEDASAEIARLTITARCRKRAADEEEPLRQIFDDECRGSGNAAHSVSFGALESSMYKRRRRALPTLPNDPEQSDKAIAESRFASLEESSFYRGQVTAAGNSSAVIFASDQQLALLRSSTVIHIDSTFRVVPKLYYQLFSIFVPHAGYLFPVLFSLMTRKTTELYETVLRKLRDLIPDFQPEQVIADFEDAPIAAIHTIFGNDVVVSGCWFHYAQALVKKVRKIGLSDAYNTDVATKQVIRCLMSLPLLRPIDITSGFEDIKTLVTPDTPFINSMKKMLSYVEKQWIKKSTVGPDRLSVHDSESRTNNAVESFHSALRRRVKVAHPNLFTFLGHLQRVTADIQAEIARLNLGLVIRRSKKRSNLINENRIKTCIRRYNNGSYTIIQYLNALSHTMGLHSSSMFLGPVTGSDDSSAEEAVVENAISNSTDTSDDNNDIDRCEVCLLEQRNSRVALVPCGHQRFCEPCAARVCNEGLVCPICRSTVNMILRLY